jgi:hypothetical protein
METGSQKKSEAIKDLAVLCKLIIETAKNKSEAAANEGRNADESEQRWFDLTLKEKQFDDQVKKERYFKLGTEAAGIVLPLVFYAVWMNRGFKFEEDGTYTSTTFRGLFSRFRPTK